MKSIDWKKVLAPTDFSEGSKIALPYAIGVAREMQAALTLVHVVSPMPPAGFLNRGVMVEEKLMLNEAAKALARFREREVPSDIPGDNLVLKGTPWNEITRLAVDQKSNLIVMATHGRTGLKHLWFGSTTENVVRHAPCSVLTIREQPLHGYLPGENPIRAKRILAPIDFSDLSIRALEGAVSLGKRFDARIDVLFVNQPPAYIDSEYANIFMVQPVMQEELEQRFQEVKQQIPGLKDVVGHFLVRNGYAAFEILQAALILNPDLLVIATHGYTGLKQVALGSTAERVVRQAACPVLLFRS